MQFQNFILKDGVNLVAASIRRQYWSAHENPGRAPGPETSFAEPQSLARAVEIQRRVIATDLDVFQFQTWKIELDQILFAGVAHVHGGKSVRVRHARRWPRPSSPGELCASKMIGSERSTLREDTERPRG